MSSTGAVRIAIILTVAVVALLGARRSGALRSSPAMLLLAAWSTGQILWVGYLAINHIPYPFLLDLMEGTVLQLATRAAHGLPLYVTQTPDFVPLAYNPGYYYLTVPFVWVFGPSITVLRAVSALGTLLSGVFIFLLVRRATASRLAGLVATGLFAAAFRAMDSHLDTAHCDSWLLAFLLGGTLLLDKAGTPRQRIVAVLAFAGAFWIKQHGALFAIGAVTFIVARDGWRAAVLPAAVAAIAGPGVYLVLGPALFGPEFHYFTFRVPSAWTEPLGTGAFGRYARFLLRWYPLLLFASTVTGLRLFFRGVARAEAWRWQLIAAALSGLMGALDAGSSDNVFIPAGTWLIVGGVITLYRLGATSSRGAIVSQVGLAASFAALWYAPSTEVLTPHASDLLADLKADLDQLGGPVYAPYYAGFPGPIHFTPAASWVAVEDMIRGSRPPADGEARLQMALEPLLSDTSGKRFILYDRTITEDDRVLRRLLGRVELVRDYGDRYAGLHFLPKRRGDAYGAPRYVYRVLPQTSP